MVLRPWCQNMFFFTLKIRLACKIWVLYLQNQGSYVNFSFVGVMCAKFWNPEILLTFWDFWLIFCMWPLNIPINKCYIAIWGQKWLLPWFLRGGLWGPPHGSHRIRYPMRGRVKDFNILRDEEGVVAYCQALCKNINNLDFLSNIFRVYKSIM